MQDQPDSYTVELLIIPECDCEARGFAIQHAASCAGFASELTREQVYDLAVAFSKLYDAEIEQGKRRRMLTRADRQLARRVIRHADTLLGTTHRYSRAEQP